MGGPIPGTRHPGTGIVSDRHHNDSDPGQRDLGVLLFGLEFPPSVAGTAVYARALAAALTSRGIEVQVLTQADPGDRWRDLDPCLPFPVTRLSYTGSVPLRYGRALRGLRLALAQTRLDCLWTTNGMATRVAGLLPRLGSLSLPLISCVRGTDIRTRLPGRGLGRRLESLPQRRCYGHSAGIAAASAELRHTAVAKGLDGSRVFVSHSAFDVGAISAPDRRIRSAGDAARVLTVARLTTQKRVDVALRAVAGALRRGVNLRYTVVGDGPELEGLRRLAADLEIADCVDFRGRLEPMSADLLDLYRGADLFLLTSVGEGLANVYIEAGALGLPCVGADSGGTPEVLLDGSTGLLSPPDDVEATTAHLVTLLQAPERAITMGHAARQWIDEEFGLETMGRRSEMAIRQAVEHGRVSVDGRGQVRG